MQLAHNEPHPNTGVPVAKVIHNFGRADQVDKAALARLVSSISRVLDTTGAATPAANSEVETVDSRRLGGAFGLDQIWDRLGISSALRSVAEDRRLDAEVVERICFALVAQRCLEPESKLAAVRWVKERMALSGCPHFDDQAAYATMEFLLATLWARAESHDARVLRLLRLRARLAARLIDIEELFVPEVLGRFRI